MDNEFSTNKAEFVKVLNKCIEMEWIAIDPNISLDGIASQFANAVDKINKDNEARKIMGQLIWYRNYYPESFNAIKNLFVDSSKE